MQSNKIVERMLFALAAGALAAGIALVIGNENTPVWGYGLIGFGLGYGGLYLGKA